MQNKEHHTMKRTDYINWDEYFMGIALLTAKIGRASCRERVCLYV